MFLVHDASELFRDSKKLLQLAVIFRPNFLQWWSKLEFLLNEDELCLDQRDLGVEALDAPQVLQLESLKTNLKRT